MLTISKRIAEENNKQGFIVVSKTEVTELILTKVNP
jgi:hypothetical protein